MGSQYGVTVVRGAGNTHTCTYRDKQLSISTEAHPRYSYSKLQCREYPSGGGSRNDRSTESKSEKREGLASFMLPFCSWRVTARGMWADLT